MKQYLFKMDVVFSVFVIGPVFADSAIELSTGNYRFSASVMLESRNILKEQLL